MVEQFECMDCRKVYKVRDSNGFCPCGGIFWTAAWKKPLVTTDLLHEMASLWRYKEYLCLEDKVEWRELTMGEGFTPLITLDRDNPSILLKLEFLSPISGIRDRGFAVLAAMLKHSDMEQSRIYPTTANDRMAWHTYMRRARLKEVQGRQEEGQTEPIYHPFFLTGIQTYALEIWEQLSGKRLEFLVLPANDPSFILGAFFGFKRLVESECMEGYPVFLLMEKEDSSKEQQSDVVNDQIMKVLDLTNGKRLSVAQAEITQAQKALHSRAIKNNEDDAVLYAGFMRYYRDNSIKDQLAVLPIGYKNGGVDA